MFRMVTALPAGIRGKAKCSIENLRPIVAPPKCNPRLLLAMRFENVFFSVRPIVLSLARSTMCSSTTFSSSRRRLQRAKPSGCQPRSEFALKPAV